MEKPDLTYTVRGFFTSFMPESKNGESAWNVIALANGGNATIYTSHLSQTLVDLRASGYCVRQAKKQQSIDSNALLAELSN